MKFLTAKTAIALTAILFLAGCSATTTKTATPTPSPSSTNPYGGGFKVNAPKATDVVLTVTGTSSHAYTMGELTSLATKTITIFEPFLKTRQSFAVISMTTLLNKAGFSRDQKIETLALNDYAFVDTAAHFIDNNAYIAVSRNGADIPMDQGGPVRIVFEDSSPYAKNLDAWNWSLKAIGPSK